MSKSARGWRGSRGGYVDPDTWSPVITAAAGAFLLVAGPLVIIGVPTGVLHTR